MKFALCSDLHLEFEGIQITNDHNADLLIMAGDITVIDSLKTTNPDGRKGITKQRTIDLFNQVSQQFPNVVVIMGNHEFYHGDWVDSQRVYRDFLAQWTNVHLLENGVLDLPDVKVLGATLWTDMDKSNPITLYEMVGYMNDFRLIRINQKGYRTLKPEDTVIRHQNTMLWMKDQLAANASQKPVIVVGHHAPSFQSVAEEYHHGSASRANPAYYSNLEDFILDHPEIKVWVHGHMHSASDYMIGGTRVLANPRGYHGYEASADNWELRYFEVLVNDPLTGSGVSV